MKRADMLESIRRLQRAIGVATRLYRFLEYAERERLRGGIRPVSSWYVQAIRDVEFYVIDGNPLPPEDA